MTTANVPQAADAAAELVDLPRFGRQCWAEEIADQMVGQMGAFGGGTGLSGPYGYGYTTPNQMALLSETARAAANQQLGQAARNSLQRGMNIPPTLEIRPGYEFNVIVTNDLVLLGPYRN